jgi:hypothetical protein
MKKIFTALTIAAALISASWVHAQETDMEKAPPATASTAAPFTRATLEMQKEYSPSCVFEGLTHTCEGGLVAIVDSNAVCRPSFSKVPFIKRGEKPCKNDVAK